MVWQKTFFGSDTSVNLLHTKGNSALKVIFKNVPSFIIESEIKTDIAEKYPSCAEINRFMKDGKPMQVVMASFSSSDDASSIITNGVFINSLFLKPKKYIGKSKPTRCFNCQMFGHISNFCRNKSKCAKCSSEDHIAKDCVSLNSKCCNCKSEHKSSD